MKVVFAGTPSFVTPILAALDDSAHEVALVVTQPDRPAGRGQRLSPPPVKLEAQRRGIVVEQPPDVNARGFPDALRRLAPDVIVVAAFGQILSMSFLEAPRKCCLNVHFSLLPRYRGAAPVPWAIIRGESHTGVSLMRIVKKLDAGPVLTRHPVEIGANETAGELEERLGRLAAPATVEAINMIEEGRAQFMEQDETDVTYAPSLKKKDGLVDWRKTGAQIQNLVRALTPWPLAWSFCSSGGAAQRLILLDVEPMPDIKTDAKPGVVAACDKRGLLVAVGDGCLLLRRVKPDGGRAMDGAAFARGHRVEAGWMFGRVRNGE